MKDKKEESFFYKYKNDSRYKAKIQLLGGTAFIFILVVWINISSLSSSPYNNIDVNLINNTVSKEENKNNNLFNNLKNNNYEYNLEITKSINEVEEKIVYTGKVFNNLSLVTKNYKDEISEYYISGDNYYLKNSDVYSLVNSSNYYSFIASSFMDLNTIINYMSIGSLKEEDFSEEGIMVKKYVVKLNDISLNSSDKEIQINYIENNNDLSVEFVIDYTNLYNFYDVNKLDKLLVTYKINNFDRVEEIKNINIK